MEFCLTYRGKVPSKQKDLNSIWAMRQRFSCQIAKLWGREPFQVLAEEPYRNAIREIGNHTFAPLYGEHVKLKVALDVTLLSGNPARAAVLSAGDLDNRLKRVVDALRMPSQANEIPDQHRQPGKTYCQMDDDSSVSEISIRLGAYLESDEVDESFAFIRVRGMPARVTLDNLSMLF